MRSWPIHGWLGLGLVAVFWALNWGLDGLRSHWGFFPLWLGFALTVDALGYRRQGRSLLTRRPRAYAWLFAVSVPAWWLFELFNARTQNWVYLGRESFSDLEYALLASLSFSTVMPAVFGAAEWVGTWGWIRRLPRGWRLAYTNRNLGLLFALGWAMLAAVLLWPRFCFPLVWGAVFALVEPVNAWAGRPTLFRFWDQGDWRPAVALGLGALLCGFFWELWNVYSYPKWVYQVPWVGRFHVFEMPLLGYGGYLPFGLELFAVYHLVAGMLPLPRVRVEVGGTVTDS